MSVRMMLAAGLLVIGCEVHAQSPPSPEPTITRSTFAPVTLQAPQPQRAIMQPATKTSAAPLVTVGSSLAIVLGLFAAFVWVSRKAAKGAGTHRELPDEALKILGKKSLGASGNIALVRCGQSVFVVGLHASGMQRLGEITGDEEVRTLEAICSGEAKASFQSALDEMQREPIQRGFIGDGVQPPPRRRLFGSA